MCMRATTRGLTLYQTRYLSWRCRQMSRKPRNRRGELEKGDSHAFLFKTIVRLTYPQKCITFTKTTANLWDDYYGKNTGEHMGGTRVMLLRSVKSYHECQTRSLRSRFFLHAYTTSDLRTFHRTCVHVRKECSLEISMHEHSKKTRFSTSCNHRQLDLNKN